MICFLNLVRLMKFMMKKARWNRKGFLIMVTVLFTCQVFGQVRFARKDVIQDLQYLREALDAAHYNLYAHVTKEVFDQNIERVCSSMTMDSLSLLEITSLSQRVISMANNGHTEIPFPGAAYITYAYAGGTLFPLELAFEGGKALVRKNWSANQDLEIGSEVISINGMPMNEVLQEIFPLISAERRYFKLAKLELMSFPRLYWQAFVELKTFDIVVDINGKREAFIVHSVGLIEGYEMKRDEVFGAARELRFLDQIAYFRPGDFSGDDQKYQRFIDSVFVEIKKKNLPDLIIDLRNNLGGDDSFSDYLVSYIADQPFRWCSEFNLKTSAILKAHVRETYDTTSLYWQQVLTYEDGTVYPYIFDPYPPQPMENRFSGNVYVLVNRQTHSQAAAMTAQMQDYGFATIVGEETGDFPSLCASQYSFGLPITGLNVKVSKGHIVRVNGSKAPEGVIPDIIIKDHLLDEDDEILAGLLEIIEEGR